MTPLSILLERAEAARLVHGANAQTDLLRQIAGAIRQGDGVDKIRDLDHVLQLVTFCDQACDARGSEADAPAGRHESWTRWLGETPSRA